MSELILVSGQSGAAKRTGPLGIVHAFEPLDSNFARLLSNIELNNVSNVVAQKLALLDHARQSKFYPSPNKNSGVGRLVPDNWTDSHCVIEAITLDDYCDQHAVGSVDLLKLDVEGAEYFVLQGATRLLSSSSPPMIVFEVNREMAEDLGSSPENIETLLNQLGYSIFGYRAARWEELSLTGFSGHEDFLALPKSAADLVKRDRLTG